MWILLTFAGLLVGFGLVMATSSPTAAAGAFVGAGLFGLAFALSRPGK